LTKFYNYKLKQVFKEKKVIKIERKKMIADKLRELGEYAEDLEKEDPVDLLNYYFNKFTVALDNIAEYQSKLGNRFGNAVTVIIKDYTSKDLLPPLISYNLLSVLISFIKKSMIEEKANSLGIEKNLYKQEMKFLFKGKWK